MISGWPCICMLTCAMDSTSGARVPSIDALNTIAPFDTHAALCVNALGKF